MNLNFELILFYGTVITGAISLLDVVYFAPKRREKHGDVKLPMLFDYARSFFPVLLLVLLLRSFLFEPFRIPSGSLEPTLHTGDFIIVNKYNYGLRLPVLHTTILKIGEPARGDIMVFRWPANPEYYFVKRIIGLPGDRISYINKELTINGQKIPQTLLKSTDVRDEAGESWVANEMQEDLLGVKHHIYLNPSKTNHDYKDIVVPEGMYFVMGDNRDNSADSRYWGFVPDENIVGRAQLIWLSWAGIHDGFIRWDRFGKMIH